VIKNILYTKYPRKKKKKEEKRSPLERVNQNLNDPRRTRCVFISAWIRICTEIFPTHYVARKDGSAQMAREKRVEKEVTGKEKKTCARRSNAWQAPYRSSW